MKIPRTTESVSRPIIGLRETVQLALNRVGNNRATIATGSSLTVCGLLLGLNKFTQRFMPLLTIPGMLLLGVFALNDNSNQV